MYYIYAIIIGTIQGITEFLPISSSGHLVILHEFIEIPINNEPAFDVALHLATLLSVLIYFYKDITAISKAWVLSIFGQGSADSRLAWNIILATLPAGLAGYFFESYIENHFRSILLVSIMLIIVGFLFIIAEKISIRRYKIHEISPLKALFIGLAQAIALIPGTSRSGITIIAGLGMKLKREAAVKFSFLMSIPIILGASIKKVPYLSFDNGTELACILLAAAAAFCAGLWAINFLLNFIKTNKFNAFAYYRFALAIILLIFLFLGK